MQLAGYRPQDVPNPFGGPVNHISRTGSTMEDARELVLSGSGTPGAVLRCDFQTAGRGQGPNRSWTAPPGSSLMFTLCLPESWVPAPREALPLRMALGLGWLLEERGYAGVAVKWPNDVLIEDKKVAGILCHHTASWFLVGMGLNVNQRRFPPDLRTPATSLALAEALRGTAPRMAPASTETIDPGALLPALLGHLRDALEAAGWRGDLERRLAGVGAPVILQHPGPGVPAVVLGIGDTGALRVRRADTGGIEEVLTRDRIEWVKKI